MQLVGTLIGGICGLLMKGPLGALLGAAIGYYFDRQMSAGARYDSERYARVHEIFFRASFSIMGHIAKADGRVSESEIAMARRIMSSLELSDAMRQQAIRHFNTGKTPGFDMQATLEEFRRECLEDAGTIRMFLEIQFTAAFADGVLHDTEYNLLWKISEHLGMSRHEFDRTVRFFQAQQRFASGWGSSNRYRQQNGTRQQPSQDALRDAYDVLGVAPGSSNSEIKKAYRRLISQNHPDKLAAKGLPEETMKLATEKTQRITKAYELVMAQQRAG